MQNKIVIPQLAGEKGRVTWSKHAGDEVAAGDVVLEVDLGYLKVPVKAPCAGRIGKLAVNDDTEVGGGGIAAMIEATEAPKKLGWACIECTFKCRACAFEVPIGELDMDGAVVCARCGLEQAFDARLWHAAFDFAHAVADRVATTDRAVLDGESMFTLKTRGGNPACATCQSEYEITTTGERATVVCKKCDTSVVYVVPAAASRMTKEALRAVIADAHRADATVKVQESASALAIQCPSCSAALDGASDSKFVTCKFCKTTSRIPNNVWFKLKGADAKPAPMWLWFEGESHARRDVEREKQKKEQEELTERIREGKRAKATAANDAKREAEDREERARERAKRDAEHDAERAEDDEEDKERIARSAASAAKTKQNIVIAVVIGLFLTIGAIIALQRW